MVAHAETELGLASGRATAHRRWSRVAALLLGVALLSVAGWKYRAAHTRMALDEFWVPVRDQAQVTMCVGGSVFAQNNFSGVATAGKDIDYPFVSMQSASAIAERSGLLARSGSPQPICSPRRQPR